MRILYVVHEFFPRFFGGTSRYVLNLAHQMQQMGHHVEVLTYGLDEPADAFPDTVGAMLARSYVHEGIQVHCLRHRVVPPTLGHRISDLEVVAAMDLFLDRAPFDLVHIAHPMRLAACHQALRKRGVPLVLTLTDFWLLCPRGRFFKLDYSPCNSPEGGAKCIRECLVESSIRTRYVEARELFDTAGALISPSQFLIDVFHRCGWRRAISRINHGVDNRFVAPLPSLRRANGKIHVGYTGVVSRFKGVDMLLKAFRAVAAPNLLLRIYGNLLDDGSFISEVNFAFGSDPRIYLMNRYDHEELPQVMSDIDVMVVPSTTLDSYGLVVVESFAAGVPVIATDMVGSALEFIRDGENGFVFPANRPEKLSQILERLSRDPEIVERLRAGITPPPRIEEEAFQVELVYRSLVGRR